MPQREAAFAMPSWPRRPSRSGPFEVPDRLGAAGMLHASQTDTELDVGLHCGGDRSPAPSQVSALMLLVTHTPSLASDTTPARPSPKSLPP